jgi:lysophospholipase L1-like esterase
VAPGTDRIVTFGGETSVTIAAGSTAVSDAVEFSLQAFTNIAVSVYLPGAVTQATFHQQGTQDNYVADGDLSDAESLPGAQTRGSYYFLTNLDVDAPDAFGAVVTLGASITDGVVSAQGQNRRWPNDLAVRLAGASKPVGVLNHGISGNKLLADGAGESALHRFERDVVGQAGVRWVIFSDDPINDLGGGSPPSGDELISAAGELIASAHAAGIEFFCSTLTPFQGAGGWSPQAETARTAYNDFVRSPGSGCDAVVDQDEATHDPAQPTWYLPAFDAGDHLHPNQDGLQAIADAVDLELFTAPAAGGASGAGGGEGSMGGGGSSGGGGSGGAGAITASAGAAQGGATAGSGGVSVAGAAGSAGHATGAVPAPAAADNDEGCGVTPRSGRGGLWAASFLALALWRRRRA